MKRYFLIAFVALAVHAGTDARAERLFALHLSIWGEQLITELDPLATNHPDTSESSDFLDGGDLALDYKSEFTHLVRFHHETRHVLSSATLFTDSARR